jgi:site-specific DNA-methyltransferase (adenine-specific)
MIWHKPNNMPHIIKNYYPTSFEYMFILSKGTPKTTNIIQVPCKYPGKEYGNYKNKDSVCYRPHKRQKTKSTKPRQNVWTLSPTTKTYGHPAVFPEQLVHDHIVTWSNPYNFIYDPFCGSGTTLVVAKKLKRYYIGSETVAKYCKIAVKHIEEV